MVMWVMTKLYFYGLGCKHMARFEVMNATEWFEGCRCNLLRCVRLCEPKWDRRGQSKIVASAVY